MKVLIIPEDQENDRYIAKPVIEAMFSDLKLSAQIDVLPEPRLRGADQALDSHMINSIITENPMVDLFILIVDRDCNRKGNEDRAVARVEEHRETLLACVARQEIEVWMLALYRNKIETPWLSIRAHCDPKEKYADSLLVELGTEGPGGGRKRAMRAISGKWRSLCTLCEELKLLHGNVRNWAKKSKKFN